jgi:hypothetical protein
MEEVAVDYLPVEHSHRIRDRNQMISLKIYRRERKLEYLGIDEQQCGREKDSVANAKGRGR